MHSNYRAGIVIRNFNPEGKLSYQLKEYRGINVNTYIFDQ